MKTTLSHLLSRTCGGLTPWSPHGPPKNKTPGSGGCLPEVSPVNNLEEGIIQPLVEPGYPRFHGFISISRCLV